MRYISLFFITLCVSVLGGEHVYLKMPNIAKETIIGTNVGIRPFRRTGVRLEMEFLQNKCIIHNYGYGGSGLTLAFGGSYEALKLLEEHPASSKVVAILGAGVVGLATAYDLLEQGYEVHLYSGAWSPNLTSDVAAGIWTPLTFPNNLPIEKKQFHEHLLKISKERFLKSISDHPEFSGIRWMNGYRLHAYPEKDDLIIHLGEHIVKHGEKIILLGIDGKVFMEDLFTQVKKRGALLKERHFENIEDILSLEESTIINCTSMGSNTLFQDAEFIPVRGQLIYFPPDNEIDYFLSQKIPNRPNEWFNLYPSRDRIILGGGYEFGEEDAVTSPEVLRRILSNAEMCLSGD